MKKMIWSVLGSAVLSIASMSAIAAPVTFSPGGPTTMAGEVDWELRDGSSVGTILFAGTCTWSMSANINASTGSFTIDSPGFSTSCSQTAGPPHQVSLDPTGLPWHGSSVWDLAFWKAQVPDLKLSISSNDGLVPPFVTVCQAPADWYFYWWAPYDPGTHSGTATSALSSGMDLYTVSGGDVCVINFQLFLSPFQTLTAH